MRLSVTDLGLIDARASTLSERLTGDFVAAGGEPTAAMRRLTRLTGIVGESQLHPLVARVNALAKGAVTESHLLAALGPVLRVPGKSVPQWHSDLNLIVEAVAKFFASKSGQLSATHRPSHRDRGVPYEHLFWPIADLAWGLVQSEHPAPSIWLNEHARFGLQKSLVRRISSVLASVLHPAFLAHIAVATSSMMQHFFDATISGDAAKSQKRHYTGFTVEQGENGLTASFTAFPVVARLVSQITRFWIEFVREFLERLTHDEEEISSRFHAGVPLGSLMGVQAGLSDSHHGGRSVLILRFRGGLRLVYKPRPMGIDHQFGDLLRAINTHSSEPGLRVLKILDRGSYGWMEFARHEACPSRAAARRYFERSGALVCLAHWLQGIDFHRENVLACGEQPLLLDLECLAHPLRDDELATVVDPSSHNLARSVLRTGLLPLWQSGIAGTAKYDNSGLNAAITQRSLFASMQWKQVNTDRMHWVNEMPRLKHAEHRVFLKGRALSITAHERQVRVGYQKMGRVLEGLDSQRYQDLRAEIYRQASRRIKRPTFFYAMILRRSLHPSYLEDGADRGIELLRLPCSRGDEEDWAAEIASLEELDIPYFQYPAGSKCSPSIPDPASGNDSLAGQVRTVSASVRRRVRLDAGRITVLPANKKGGIPSQRFGAIGSGP